MDKKSDKEKKQEKKSDLELRPHHVWGYLDHENNPHWYDLPDDEYIELVKDFKRRSNEEAARNLGMTEEQVKEAGEFAYRQHSDKVILHQRTVLKKIHDDPSTEFKYVSGLDTVCEECNLKEGCLDEHHPYFKTVQEADKNVNDLFPELEPGKSYKGYDIIKLFKKKGLLKKQE